MNPSSVLLVSANAETVPYPVYPLALPVLASALEDEGHEVLQHDVLVSPAEELARAIEERRPGLVGASVRNLGTTQSTCRREYLGGYEDTMRLVRELTDAPVVLGGSGFSIFPCELMELLDADYGVVGAGEGPLCRIAAAVSSGSDPGDVPGLIRRGEDRPRPAAAHTPGRRWAPSHDSRLVRWYWDEGGMIGLQSKRGCAERCSYCTYPLIEGGRVTAADPDSVVRDIVRLRERHGVDYFFFVDSVFNADREAGIRLAERIASEAPGISWGGFFTPRGIDEEYLAPLKASGLTHIELGTDSFAAATLAAYGKGFGVEDVLRANRAAMALDIHVAHYVIFGGPGETEESVREGLALADGLGRAVVFASLGMRIFPGTDLCRIATEEGLVEPPRLGLEPAFYFSPAVDRDGLLQTLEAFASARRGWLLPSAMERCIPGMKKFRKFGRKGPLWEFFATDAREREAAK
ncbi:MAG: lipid biosynthesis B12-binding/radical SAM protein [Planctomycetota bacterium]|jgi:radical SAM superfamily enzyme YgiQ (UPF0313 family)